MDERNNDFLEKSSEEIMEDLGFVRSEQQFQEEDVQEEEGEEGDQFWNVNINHKRLGYLLDGWAELIEGMGEKAEEVRKETLNRLEFKEMPDIRVYGQVVSDHLFSGKRDYIFSETYPGATTGIYIAKHGKDLYVSWRTWLKEKLNLSLIIILAGVAVLIGYLTFGTGQVSMFSPRGFWALGWIVATIVILLLEIGLVSYAGRAIKGYSFYYFLIHPSVFDAEDITAMSLSAHYALLRSLDNAGVDTSKLRIKTKFTGGRRGEDI